MKKNVWIITLVLSIAGVSAYGINRIENESQNTFQGCQLNDSSKVKINDVLKKATLTDFHYDVDNRFATSITKTELFKAKNLFEIFPKHATTNIKDLYNSKVGILTPEGEITELGTNQIMTNAQLSLLQKVDYSTDFFIFGNYKTEAGEENYIVYYMTVVPETEASYEMGNDALLYYLKEKSKEVIKEARKERLEAGKVRFSINTKGLVESVVLDATSGYSAIDSKMIELIKAMPGKWSPAKDAKGNLVNQEFVFSFGIIGC